MKKSIVKYKKNTNQLSFPKWLQPYHLLIFGLIVMIIFGAMIKFSSKFF